MCHPTSSTSRVHGLLTTVFPPSPPPSLSPSLRVFACVLLPHELVSYHINRSVHSHTNNLHTARNDRVLLTFLQNVQTSLPNPRSRLNTLHTFRVHSMHTRSLPHTLIQFSILPNPGGVILLFSPLLCSNVSAWSLVRFATPSPPPFLRTPPHKHIHKSS